MPGDVVITNYESEPPYFYTGLPQGLKILANAPVYDAARRQHLPEYVFGVARALDSVAICVGRVFWRHLVGGRTSSC
jgi:hypothetical protein